MIDWYWRDGTPATDMKAIDEKLHDPTYKIIKQETLDTGYWLSTVWLGLDHRFGDGPPLIFETMVFPNSDDLHDLDMERYSTEDGARQGHEEMKAKWSYPVVQPKEELQ